MQGAIADVPKFGFHPNAGALFKKDRIEKSGTGHDKSTWIRKTLKNKEHSLDTGQGNWSMSASLSRGPSVS